jgi:hypothetical protein
VPARREHLDILRVSIGVLQVDILTPGESSKTLQHLGLRFDPYGVFRRSKTPAGLYARQKWLGEENHIAWKADFKSTAAALLAGQSDDGSWGGSVLQTIQRLFGLHLTVRDPNEGMDKALDWLLDIALKKPQPIRRDIKERLSNKNLRGLPFSPGCSGLFVIGAALFLATIFGRNADPRILETYGWLEKEGIERGGRWCGWSCSNNVLRAFAVHPEFCKSEALYLAVTALGRAQHASGRWLVQVPFYQTVNALAHLDLTEAEIQIKRALKHLLKTQHKDGTWGKVQREWNTFLVVHALRNKGLL